MLSKTIIVKYLIINILRKCIDL